VFMLQRLAATVVMLLAFSPAASAIGIIKFDTLDEGDAVSTQYAPGVIFTAGISGVTGLTNPSGPGVSFDENTPLHVTHTNVGSVTGSIDGLLLHSFDDFRAAEGDPVFTIDFLNPIQLISLQFIGVNRPGSTIYAVDDSNEVIASATAPFDTSMPVTSTVTLSLTEGVKRFVVTVGTLWDWVGVDNIAYLEVQSLPHENPTPPEETPEPSTFVLLCAGAGGLVLVRRYKRG
jgi:hypothetical protein